jgi:hypothetical protein
MTNHTCFPALSIRRPPEGGHSTDSTIATARARRPPPNANSPVRSHDRGLDDVPDRRPVKTPITRQNALNIAVHAALSQAEQWRALALPYPVEYQVFWQVLADMGMTQERVMDRLGASP